MNGFNILKRLRASGSSLGREVLVVLLGEGRIHALHLDWRRGPVKGHWSAWKSPEDAAPDLKQLGRDCQVVALLPKSHYLVRDVEIPKVLPREVPMLLGLELEVLLPVDLGPLEVAYRSLASADESRQKLEVYIARANELRDYLEALRAYGLEPHRLMPTAWGWHAAVRAHLPGDLLVAAGDDRGGLELAHPRPGGGLSVCRVSRLPGDDGATGLNRGLVDAIRSLLGPMGPDASPLVVGWLGAGCPASCSTDGRVVFKSVDDPTEGRVAFEGEAEAAHPLLVIAAQALFEAKDDASLENCDLIPQSALANKRRNTVLRRAAAGAACVVAGMLLVYVGLEIAISRCRGASDDLAAKIALVETQGRAVGRRLRQLDTVRAARHSASRLQAVLAGLHDGTPPGVTYCRVELGQDGSVRLQGQAESLALPFLLPEMLEKEPAFTQVILRDAGQQKKGAGTVTEFRVDCQYEH
jgi:hypothetical protein